LFHQQSAKPLKNIILAREWMWLNTCHNFLSVITSTRLKLGHNYKFSWYTFARQPGADGMVLNAANYLSLKSQTYTPTHPFVSDALPGCVWWSYPPFCVDRSSPFFCAPSRGGGAAHWRWKAGKSRLLPEENFLSLARCVWSHQGVIPIPRRFHSLLNKQRFSSWPGFLSIYLWSAVAQARNSDV